MEKTTIPQAKKIVTGEDLLEALEKEYIDRLPMAELTPFEHGKLVGSHEVLNHIRALLK